MKPLSPFQLHTRKHNCFCTIFLPPNWSIDIKLKVSFIVYLCWKIFFLYYLNFKTAGLNTGDSFPQQILIQPSVLHISELAEVIKATLLYFLLLLFTTAFKAQDAHHGQEVTNSFLFSCPRLSCLLFVLFVFLAPPPLLSLNLKISRKNSQLDTCLSICRCTHSINGHPRHFTTLYLTKNMYTASDWMVILNWRYYINVVQQGQTKSISSFTVFKSRHFGIIKQECNNVFCNYPPSL